MPDNVVRVNTGVRAEHTQERVSMECNSQEHRQPLGARAISSTPLGPDVSERAKAIELALRDPFDVVLAGNEPILSKSSESGMGGDWAVYAGCPQGWSEEHLLEGLRKKLNSARPADGLQCLDGSSITTADLRKKSGTWPSTDTCLERDLGGNTYSWVRVRLLLLSKDEAVGFCTFSVHISLRDPDVVPFLRVEVGTVFIEPKWRGKGLSRLLVDAVVNVTLRVFKELQARLCADGVREELDVALLVVSDVISKAGGRFLDAVGRQIWSQTRQGAIAAPQGPSAFRIAKMRVWDDHLQDADEYW